jgi:hypothetical protein
MDFMKKDEFKMMVSVVQIESKIYIIRGNKVMIDEDLAVLYGVETKVLNQAAKRNPERFPEDFAFQLDRKEWGNLKSQIVTSSAICLRSQSVTSKISRGGRRYLPYVFTEQGVAMLSSILRSPQAVKVNIEIMRAFVRLRHSLASLRDVTKELAELKSFLLKHSHSTDREFKRVWSAIEKLAKPLSGKEQHKIGFDVS